MSTILFDHKNVNLSINRPIAVRKDIVKDTILNNVDLVSHIKSAVYECYLHHCTISAEAHQGQDDITRPNAETVNNHLLSIGRVMVLLDEIKNLDIKIAVEGFTERDDLLISAKRAEVNLIFDDMPPLEYFENLHTECSPSIFFQH